MNYANANQFEFKSYSIFKLHQLPTRHSKYNMKNHNTPEYAIHFFISSAFRMKNAQRVDCSKRLLSLPPSRGELQIRPSETALRGRGGRQSKPEKMDGTHNVTAAMLKLYILYSV